MVMTKPVYNNRVGNEGFPLLHSLLYPSGEDDASSPRVLLPIADLGEEEPGD